MEHSRPSYRAHAKVIIMSLVRPNSFFGITTVVGLRNMINGLDHEVQAHFNQENEKSVMGEWIQQNQKHQLFHFTFPKVHFFTPNAPQITCDLHTICVNLTNKHDWCLNVAHEGHLHM